MDRRHLVIRLSQILFVATLTSSAAAVTAPPGFIVEPAFPGASFSRPVQIVFLPDGRTLVAEEWGRVWVVTAEGVKLPTPFIDLLAKVSPYWERGLLGAAIDPDFVTNRWVYLAYTVDPDSNGVDTEDEAFSRVERYRASLADPNVADLTSRQILVGHTWPTGIPSPERFHAMGSLRFGADKTLLVASGEGAHPDSIDAGGRDPDEFLPGRADPAEDIGSFRARTLNSLCGKILRLDKETGGGLPSNPYWDGNAVSDRSRVWMYGFRNAYRFCVRPGTGSADPAQGQPGVLFVGDVGGALYEELIVAQQGGGNYGWPCEEGPLAHPSYAFVQQTFFPNPNVLCSAAPSSENPAANAIPQLWFHHVNANASNPAGWIGQCIIGGVFYMGGSYPAAYAGRYFVGDYDFDWVMSVEVNGNNEIVTTESFLTGADGPVDIESDPASGDLYYIAMDTEEVRRIRYAPQLAADAPPAPVAALECAPNPFSTTTRLEFVLPDDGPVTLGVYTAAGRCVRTISSGARTAGRHVLVWDGTNDAGGRLPSGTYYARLETGAGVVSSPVRLIR